jgi:hypothetical protein
MRDLKNNSITTSNYNHKLKMKIILIEFIKGNVVSLSGYEPDSLI